MEIRNLTADELEAIQTVVDYDNKDRKEQLTVGDAINARVESDITFFVERAEKIELEQINEKFKKSPKSKKNQIKDLLAD